MKNILKKVLTKKYDIVNKILESKSGSVDSIITYTSSLTNEEKKIGLRKALEFYVNKGHQNAAEKITKELDLKLSNNQKITILEINIKEDPRYMGEFLDLAESLKEGLEKNDILEKLLKTYIKNNKKEVVKTLSLLGRDLNRNESKIFLKANIKDGKFKESKAIVEKIGRDLTQEELLEIFDNKSSYVSGYFERIITLVELINEPKKTEKISQLLGKVDFEKSFALIDMLNEPKKTIELNLLIERQDADDRMSFRSKIEVIALMSKTEKLRNINIILNKWFNASSWFYNTDDFEELLSFLSSRNKKKQQKKFLKKYINFGMFWLACFCVDLLKRDFSTKELNNLLEIAFNRGNSDLVRDVLRKYPESKRKSKIKYIYLKYLENDQLLYGTSILKYFQGIKIK